jgi:hypothetical protein
VARGEGVEQCLEAHGPAEDTTHLDISWSRHVGAGPEAAGREVRFLEPGVSRHANDAHEHHARPHPPRSRVQQEAPRRASLAVQPLHQHDSLPVTDGVIRFVLMCHGLISTPRAPLADAYCQFCVQTCAATAASRRRSFIRCSHLCVCVCVFSVCVFITAVPIIKPFGWARGIVDEPRPV